MMEEEAFVDRVIEHAMAVEKVRHVGDLVACVAAEDEATAREAERLIKVEYEVLESIHDMRRGLENSEHPIHGLDD